MALNNVMEKPGWVRTVPRYAKTHIEGAVADTAVKASAGVLARVVVNTAGAASSSVSLYDGAVSGTPFAVIDGTALGSYQFDADCSDSIHVATVDSGGNMDVTILWV